MSRGEWLSFLMLSVHRLRVVGKQGQNMDAIHVYGQPGKRGRNLRHERTQKGGWMRWCGMDGAGRELDLWPECLLCKHETEL